MIFKLCYLIIWRSWDSNPRPSSSLTISWNLRKLNGDPASGRTCVAPYMWRTVTRGQETSLSGYSGNTRKNPALSKVASMRL